MGDGLAGGEVKKMEGKREGKRKEGKTGGKVGREE